MEQEFLEWTREMTKRSTFSSQNERLTEDHLLSLLKVEPFCETASQIMRHVKPRSEMRHIRLNLSRTVLWKNDIDEQSSDIGKKYSSLVLSTENAGRETDVEAQELKRIVEEEERLNCEERDLQRQIALLDIAIKDKAAKVKNLKHWTTTISQFIPEYPSSSSAQEKSIRQEAANDDLKEILTKLKELKQRLLYNKSPDFHDNKVEVWQLVESLLERHSPSAVMKALCSLTLKETSALSQATQQIDLAADAKTLRLKYTSSGQLADDLSPQGVLESVESMLVQMSGKHIVSHVKNHKKSQNAQLVVQALENIMNNIQSVAKELYGDPLLVCEIMVLCKETLRLAGLKASLATSVTLLHDLEVRANIANKAKETMLKDYNKIIHFDNEVKNGMFELKSLALGASQSWDVLEDQKNRVCGLVEGAVSCLVLPTPFFDGVFSKEVEALMDIPFHIFKAIVTQEGPVSCPPLGLVECATPHLDVCGAAPYLTTWDNFIDVVRRKKLSLREQEGFIVDEIASLESLTEALKKQSLSKEQVKDLCAKANLHDSVLEAKILPIISGCERMHDKMETKLDELEAVIKEWWSQPGSSVNKYLKREAKK